MFKSSVWTVKVYKMKMLAHSDPWGIFGLKGISIICTILIVYVLNCFKYFLIYVLKQIVSQSPKKDFELYQFLCADFFFNIF